MQGMDGMMDGWGPAMMVLWIIVLLLVLVLALYGLVRLIQDLGSRHRGPGRGKP